MTDYEVHQLTGVTQLEGPLVDAVRTAPVLLFLYVMHKTTVASELENTLYFSV